MRKCAVQTRILLVVVICLLLIMSSATAFAEPINTVVELRVAAQMLHGKPMLFVMATLDENVTLPVQVPIAVPKGSGMEWVGELTGGDAQADAETTYELKETVGAWDIYLVDATTQHALQIETSFPDAYLISTGETTGKASFTYVPATDADILIVAAESPQNLIDFDQNTGYEVFGQGIGGGMVIGPSFQQAKAGQEYSVTYSFQTGTETTGDTTTTDVDSFGAVLILLVIVLLGLLAFLFILINRQRGRTLPFSTHPSGSAHKRGEATDQSHAYKPGQKKAKAPSTFRWNSPQTIIIALIALVAIGALIWTSQRDANRITENNGVYTQQFSAGDPCRSIDFALTDNALLDPEASARELFSLMRNADIILLSASLDSNTGILTVQFCESQTDDLSVATLVEQSGLVVANNLRTLNTPIVRDDGNLAWYIAQFDPCVTSSFSIADAPGDPVAFVQKLAEAVRDVPSITGVVFDAKNQVAWFGYCEEQANDAQIATALEKAGIDTTLKTEATTFTGEGVFAR